MHVHHHTLLQSQGGTARVAQSLLGLLPGLGITAGHSYELQDSGTPGIKLSPEQVASQATPDADAIIHLHASRDWPACLRAFSRRKNVPLITLHDCRLLTGGCASPLSCRQWETGCAGACPQNLQGTGSHWKNVHTLLDELHPSLVAPSAWLARMVRALHPNARVRIIPNGIVRTGPDPLPKNEVKQSLGIHPASKVVLFVAHGGKRAMYKGGHLWADIWARMKSCESRAVALAVGGESIARNGDFLELPCLNQENLIRCMDAADVLVYPSLADNHPLLVLEAMSRSLPCAAFAAGGIPEQIVNGRTGLLAPPGNVECLAALALRILWQPRFGKYLASQALKRYQALFRLERMGKAYLDVYRQMHAVQSGNAPAQPHTEPEI